MGRAFAWIGRLLRIAPRQPRRALRLKGPCSVVPGSGLCPAEFLEALRLLVPDGCVLFLESYCHATPPLERYLEAHTERAGADIPRGTIWPRLRLYRIRVTGEALRDLSRLVERCAGPEFCVHLHVHDHERLLLQWYDAFADPILVSKRLPAERVAAFCAALGRSARDALAP